MDMDHEEYRRRAKKMVDYIVEYIQTVRERPIYPFVKPGYLHRLTSDQAPEHGEPFDDILSDIERVIMPGVTHWQSPNMHAYYPAISSYPAMLAEMLSDALNSNGFTWASSPACTELEILATNMLGKMMNLPEKFLNLSKDSTGGGVIQTTTSEATLVTLLAARTKYIKYLLKDNEDMAASDVVGYLVAYCSDQAHSSVEKAGLIALVKLRFVESDDNFSMRGDRLEELIVKDILKGLVPAWVCVTLGTTGACSFDNLQEVAKVCKKYDIWLHIDAAYAGSAFICPEYRQWMSGIEHAHSIAVNASKWLLCTLDISCLWVEDSKMLHNVFNVNPLYLQHENSGHAIDYMHWQMGLSRRFRSLKLWFVIRSYGVSGLQAYIRETVRLAKVLEEEIRKDPRFEIPATRHLGLTVFRLQGDNALTEKLLQKVNFRRLIHCVPACLKTTYVIRFVMSSPYTTENDVMIAWKEFQTVASELLMEVYGCTDGNVQKNVDIAKRHNKVPLKDINRMNPNFGTSLILANSPMSPKVVNGSFAALTDFDTMLTKFTNAASLCYKIPEDSPAMRRRIRGIQNSTKTLSLDSCMDMVQVLISDDIKKQQLPKMTEDNNDDAGTSEAPANEEKPQPNTVSATSIADSSNHLSVSGDANHGRQRSRSVDSEALGTYDREIALASQTAEKEPKNSLERKYEENGPVESSVPEDEEVVWLTPTTTLDSSLKSNGSASPGKYIKKMIQQFSETSFNVDENSDLGLMASFNSIKDNANAICKKCLHYKGKVTKNQNDHFKSDN